MRSLSLRPVFIMASRRRSTKEIRQRSRRFRLMFSSGFLREFSRRRSSFPFTPQPAASASEEPEISVPRLGRERLPLRAAAWCARGGAFPGSFPAKSRRSRRNPLWSARPVSVPQQADPAKKKSRRMWKFGTLLCRRRASEAPQTADPLGGPILSGRTFRCQRKQLPGAFQRFPSQRRSLRRRLLLFWIRNPWKAGRLFSPEPVQENPDAEIQEE